MRIISSEFTIVTPEDKYNKVIVKRIEKLEPKQFCRLMFGKDSLDEGVLQELENTAEYLGKARWLLMQVLGVRLDHIRNWGRHFQKKVSDHHKRTLWIYWQWHKNEKKQEDELLVS